MRIILCLFLLLASPALAQTPAPTAPVADWKSLGKPLDDDSKSMMDRYVYMNTDASDKNIPLDRAVLSQRDIQEWINENLAQVLTLDGRNYDSQVYNSRLVFTPTGYADYILYLRNANFAKFLKDNQYKVTSFVQGSPAILSEGVQTEAGKFPYYRWQAKAILILSYLDYRNQTPAALFKDVPKDKIDNRLPIQANIELIRIPMQANGSVIAINHLAITAPDPEKPTESLDPAATGL